ncbi:hypothetical protein [Peribacillus sp. TH14]|uniref:hypothetical protein n=1 Tax=Peribacillus sp. TH14 TaxID=2798481 RepID=UPI001914380E|nr:hypothetical protein [Peribacillus sp. TH14]MBK5502853.1 hypothetical protein [Peribacillus sp. TH14]
MRCGYRQGFRKLDEVAHEKFVRFKDLSENERYLKYFCKLANYYQGVRKFYGMEDIKW